MSPCVNRKAGGGRAVFTVPPPPPFPGQCSLQQANSSPSDQQGSPNPTAAPATPVVHSQGNVGGPHGPNLGVNPHRQTAAPEPAPADVHQGGTNSSLTPRGGRQGHHATGGSLQSMSHQQQVPQHMHSSPPGIKPMVCPQHLDLVSIDPHAPACLDPGLHSFWCSLSLQQRRQLLRLPKKDLFARVRSLYCSGCFALIQLQYDELCAYVANHGRNNGSGTPQCAICAAGHACFAGLSVSEDGAVTLTDDLLVAHPFGRFEQARMWDQTREQHFSCSEVCGSGWCKRPGVNKCKLHTGPVSPDELLAYWSTLPGPRREALMTLDEETFLGELDVSMKLQLRICKECRSNVTRAFKELKPGRDATGQANAATGLLLCEGHELRAGEGRVRVEGPGEACLFEKAEEVQEQKAFDAAAGDQDSPETIRHAETPELAREALQDSALLIFKAQVEVAFRDQTACRNALLLFAVLCHGLLEQRLENAYKELGAKQAEAELLRLLEEDEAKEAARREKKASKARAKKLQTSSAMVASLSGAPDQQPTSDSEDMEPEQATKPPPPAATSVAKDSPHAATATQPVSASGSASSKAAAQEKGRDSASSSGSSAGGNKQATALKQHQQQCQPTALGKQSRASSLEDSLPETVALNASAAASSRTVKQHQQTSAHAQQNGNPLTAPGKAAGRTVAATPAASNLRGKEHETAAGGKEKGHKSKEVSAAPAAAAVATTVGKAGKSAVPASGQQSKGNKAAADAAPPAGPKAGLNVAAQPAVRPAPAVAVRQPPVPGLRQVQHVGPPPPPPPPPPRQQQQSSSGANASGVSAGALGGSALSSQPPAPQLNNSNFPPLRPASSGATSNAPTPQRAASPPLPQQQSAQPAAPQSSSQAFGSTAQLQTASTAPAAPQAPMAPGAQPTAAPPVAPVTAAAATLAPTTVQPPQTLQAHGAAVGITADAQISPAEQGLAQLVLQSAPPRAPQQQEQQPVQQAIHLAANGPAQGGAASSGFQHQPQQSHQHQPQQQGILNLGHVGTSPMTAPPMVGVQSLAPGPAPPAAGGGAAKAAIAQQQQQQPPLQQPFDVAGMAQLRRPSPDHLTRLQVQQKSSQHPQAVLSQGLGQAPGSTSNGLLGLGPFLDSTSPNGPGHLSSTGSLQSQGSGLLAHGPSAAAGGLTGSQATAGFGWQLPLSPQQPLQQSLSASQQRDREQQQLHSSAPSPSPQAPQHQPQPPQQQLAALAMQQQQHQAAAAAAAVAAAAAMGQQAAHAQAAAALGARPLFPSAPHLQAQPRPQQQQSQQLSLGGSSAGQSVNLSPQNAAQLLAAHAHAHAQAQLQAHAQMQAQAQSASHQQFQQQQQQQTLAVLAAAAAAAAEDAVNAQAVRNGAAGSFSLFSHFPSTLAAREAELRQQLELQQQRTQQHQLKAQQHAAEERQQQQQQVLQATLQQQMQQQVLQAQLQQQQAAAALQSTASGLTAHQAQQLTTYLLQQQAQQQQQQAVQQRQVAQAAQHAQQLLARQQHQQQAQQQQHALAAQQQAQAQAAQVVAQAQAAVQAAQAVQAQAGKQQQAQQHDALSAPWSVLGRSLQQQQAQAQQLSVAAANAASANGNATATGMGGAGSASQLLFPGLAGAGSFLNGTVSASGGLGGMAAGLNAAQGLANGPGAGTSAGLGVGADHHGVSGLGHAATSMASWMRGAQADGVLGSTTASGASTAGAAAQYHSHNNQHLRQSISLSNLMLGGAGAAGAGSGGGSSLAAAAAALEGGFFGQGQHHQLGLKGGGGMLGAGAGHGMFGSQGSLLAASALGGAGAATATSAAAGTGAAAGRPGSGTGQNALSGIGGAGLGAGGQGLGSAGLGGLGLGGLGGGLGMLSSSTAGAGLRDAAGAGNVAASGGLASNAAGAGTYSLFGASPSPSIAQSLVGMTSLLG